MGEYWKEMEEERGNELNLIFESSLGDNSFSLIFVQVDTY